MANEELQFGPKWQIGAGTKKKVSDPVLDFYRKNPDKIELIQNKAAELGVSPQLLIEFMSTPEFENLSIETPEVPGIGATRGTPGIPGTPEIPRGFGQRRVPATPGTPAIPGTLGVGGTPAVRHTLENAIARISAPHIKNLKTLRSVDPYDTNPYSEQPGIFKLIADMGAGHLQSKAAKGRTIYERPRIAPPSKIQERAQKAFIDRIQAPERRATEMHTHDRLRQLREANTLGKTEPYIERASEGVTAGHRNPYVQSVRENVLGPLQEEMTQNLLENILPHIDADRLSHGNFHGGHRSEMRARAIRDLNKELSRESRRALNEGLMFGQSAAERHKERQMHAAQLVGNVGGEDVGHQVKAAWATGDILNQEHARDLTELEAHYGIGSREQQLIQAQLDKDYADFKDQEEGLMPELERQALLQRGIPGPQTRSSFTPPPAAPGLMSQMGGLGLMATGAMMKDKNAAHGGRMRYANGGLAEYTDVGNLSGNIGPQGQLNYQGPAQSRGQDNLTNDPRYAAIMNRYNNSIAHNSHTTQDFSDSITGSPVWKGLEVGDKVSDALGGNKIYDFASNFLKLAGGMNAVNRHVRQNDRVNSADQQRRNSISDLTNTLNSEYAVKDKATQARLGAQDAASGARMNDWKAIQAQQMQQANNPTINESDPRIQAARAQTAALRAGNRPKFADGGSVSEYDPNAMAPSYYRVGGRARYADGGSASTLANWQKDMNATKSRLGDLRFNLGDDSMASQAVQQNVVNNAMPEGDMGAPQAPPPSPSPMAPPSGAIERGTSGAMSALDKMNEHRSKLEGQANAYESGAHNDNPWGSMLMGIGSGLASGNPHFHERFGNGIEMGRQGFDATHAANKRNQEISMNIRKNLMDTYQKEHEDQLKKESAIEVAKIKAENKTPKLYYNKKTGTHYMMGEQGLQVAPGAPAPQGPEEAAEIENKKYRGELRAKSEATFLEKQTEKVPILDENIQTYREMEKLLPDIGATGPLAGPVLTNSLAAVFADPAKRQIFEGLSSKVLQQKMTLQKGNQSENDRIEFAKSVPGVNDPKLAALYKARAEGYLSKRELEAIEFKSTMVEGHGVPLRIANKAFSDWANKNPLMNEDWTINLPKDGPEDYLPKQYRSIDYKTDLTSFRSNPEAYKKEAFEPVSQPISASAPAPQASSDPRENAKRELIKRKAEASLRANSMGPGVGDE